MTGINDKVHLDDLYQEIILDHYKHPRNFKSLSDEEALVDEENPTCGDQIRLTAKVEQGRITDVKYEAKGCAISVASSSMMSESLTGKTVEDRCGRYTDGIVPRPDLFPIMEFHTGGACQERRIPVGHGELGNDPVDQPQPVSPVRRVLPAERLAGRSQPPHPGVQCDPVVAPGNIVRLWPAGSGAPDEKTEMDAHLYRSGHLDLPVFPFPRHRLVGLPLFLQSPWHHTFRC